MREIDHSIGHSRAHLLVRQIRRNRRRCRIEAASRTPPASPGGNLSTSMCG
ncbi:MAG: hypothetical protein MZU97_25650 [Bacillus subtilis]|nr:hypothetical protein [Bacillus subtilis]